MGLCERRAGGHAADPAGEAERRQNRFEFDTVFPAHTGQADVFAEVEPLLRSSLDGCNVCIFAYGQVRFLNEPCPPLITAGNEPLLSAVLRAHFECLGVATLKTRLKTPWLSTLLSGAMTQHWWHVPSWCHYGH